MLGGGARDARDAQCQEVSSQNPSIKSDWHAHISISGRPTFTKGPLLQRFTCDDIRVLHKKLMQAGYNSPTGLLHTNSRSSSLTFALVYLM